MKKLLCKLFKFCTCCERVEDIRTLGVHLPCDKFIDLSGVLFDFMPDEGLYFENHLLKIKGVKKFHWGTRIILEEPLENFIPHDERLIRVKTPIIAALNSACIRQ